MKLRFASMLFASSVMFACGTPTSEDAQPELPRALAGGEKADNFRSESAQEYFVRGTTTVELEPQYAELSEEERLARVQELIPYRQVVIGWFLNEYLIDKSHDASNASYGGMQALTKNDSYESLNIRHVEGEVYAFDFVQEIGGQLDLLAELGRKADATPHEDGTWTLSLRIGKISTAQMQRLTLNNEWYRSAPWSSFNPDTLSDEQLETIELNLEAQERSTDAWIDYPRLIEDGVVDVSIFFGWDYHNDYHIRHAKSVFESLVRNGYESTVSYDEYATNRVPLTRTIRVGDQDVEYRITLWWGQPGTDTDPDTDAGGIKLEDEMVAALGRDEVIAFSGHSGSFYGFALANWRMTAEGDLDDSELRDLYMPSDKYQIVLAEGCDTYAIGQAFFTNPNKSDRLSLDIITTTSFSDAGTPNTVLDFLKAIGGTDAQGNLQPMTYSEMLKDMDSNSYWFQTMYGVHGIDDNPRSNPLADTAQLCGECRRDADCSTGGACINVDGEGVCTFRCTADDGCPADFVCQEAETNGWLTHSYCVPDTLTCG